MRRRSVSRETSPKKFDKFKKNSIYEFRETRFSAREVLLRLFERPFSPIFFIFIFFTLFFVFFSFSFFSFLFFFFSSLLFFSRPFLFLCFFVFLSLYLFLSDFGSSARIKRVNFFCF